MRPVKTIAQIAAVAGAVMLSAADCAALTGAWRGELEVAQIRLPLVFNFTEDGDSTLCTLDSPSQGAKGIPARVSVCTADSVSLTCSAIGASYSGRISEGAITGTFKQGPYTLTLNLVPDTTAGVRRPQTPAPPYPYTTADTVFAAPDGAVMSATLTLPANAAPGFPAVVMVTGSGPQNRDEEIFDHKPFAVIADRLARNGIASLRYDDRGTGKSGGHFASATTYTFCDDAMAATELLRGVPGVGKTGVLGHSEGGTIAFMAAAAGKADFIVSLAGMALSGKETLMRQNRHGLATLGLSDSDTENSLRLIGLLYDTIAAQARDGVPSPIDADELARTSGITVPPQIIESVKAVLKARSPWFDTFVALDPAEFLARIKCPVLAVNGDKDIQVDADNLAAIQRLVPHATVMRMSGLNHLLQHAATGEIAEYSEISETIAPEVLDAIAAFISAQ